MNKHLREVELNVEVVVAERVVLSRIEHLEQGRGWVTTPVGADLVDLVQHDHRVHRPSVSQRPHQPPRKGADVGAAMTADLGLVTHAAERHANELAAGGPRNRFADRGLTGTRRPDQREDHSRATVVGNATVGPQLANGQVLGDPVLDVLEARVIGVQHLSRVHRIQTLVGALRPRHSDQPVDVGANHGGLARRFAHPLEPAELALGLLTHLVGHTGLVDLLAVLIDDRRVVLAQLLADRVHLLSQEVLALLLLGARLDVVADALTHLGLGQRFTLQLEGQRQPLDHLEGLEQLHLVFETHVGRIPTRVGQGARITDRAKEGRNAPVVATQLQLLLDHGAILALELAGLDRRGQLVGVLLDGDAQLTVGARLGSADGRAMKSGQRDRLEPARKPHVLVHRGHNADLGELVFVPGNEQHSLLGADVDRQGYRHIREDDRVVQWDEKQCVSHARIVAPDS